MRTKLLALLLLLVCGVADAGTLKQNVASQPRAFTLRRADGTKIETTVGVTVTVGLDTTTLTAGAGTMSFAGGQLIYTPTQAETNGNTLLVRATHAEAEDYFESFTCQVVPPTASAIAAATRADMDANSSNLNLAAQQASAANAKLGGFGGDTDTVKTTLEDLPTLSDFQTMFTATLGYTSERAVKLDALDVASSDLEEKIDGITVDLTDIDQESVPPLRTVVFAEQDPSEGLVGEFKANLTVGDSRTFAFDFRKDLAINDRVAEVEIIEIVDGTAGGLTFGTPGRDGSQAKCRVTAVTAGTYVVRVKVTYRSGSEATGLATLVARAAS